MVLREPNIERQEFPEGELFKTKTSYKLKEYWFYYYNGLIAPVKRYEQAVLFVWNSPEIQCL